ncbi:MAG TPA: hypothetical protein VJV78_11835 [Polyangiales bacterium]|nr:hypothetical protein [Polyangiales bacterium]
MLNVQAQRAVRWVSCALVLGVGCGGVEREASGMTTAAPVESGGSVSAVPRVAAGSGSGGAGNRAVSAAGGGAGVPAAVHREESADAGAADSGPTGPREYTVSMCPGATPNTLPATRTACDGVIKCGGAASCLPGVRPGAERAPECSTGRCIPDAVAIAGRVKFRPCDGSAGPGACIPLCFALQRNPLSAVFPPGEAGCGTQEVCVPCINPLDQTSSGACDDTCAER